MNPVKLEGPSNPVETCFLFQFVDLGMENISDGVCDAVGATNVDMFRGVSEVHIS